jgi:hypothetical protein
MPRPGQRIEVFIVTLIAAQGNDRVSQAPGGILVAVAIQTPREEPVNVDPDRSTPVPGRGEREAVAVVAGTGVMLSSESPKPGLSSSLTMRLADSSSGIPAKRGPAKLGATYE